MIIIANLLFGSLVSGNCLTNQPKVFLAFSSILGLGSYLTFYLTASLATHKSLCVCMTNLNRFSKDLESPIML